MNHVCLQRGNHYQFNVKKKKKTYGNITSIVDEDVRTNVLTWTEQVRPSWRLMAEEGKDNKRSTRT